MAFVYWIHSPDHTDITTQGYIGYTSGTVKNRWQEHKEESRRSRFSYYPLYRAMNKYENLEIKTLVEGSEDYCLAIEFKLRSKCNIGWNICEGGGRGAKGRIHSEETKRKISESGKGLKRSEQTKANISKSLIGIKRSDETKTKLSEKAKNRSPEHQAKLNFAAANITDETRLKMSENAKNRYKECPWKHPNSIASNWSLALQINDYCKEGISKIKIAKLLFLQECQVRTIFKKIKSGWNPLTDEKYLSWLEEYKQKEAINAKT